jgi:hypothetical protein
VTIHHVMAYASRPDGPYSYPYAVHLFAEAKPTYEGAFEEASAVLKRAFGVEADVRYVGCEELPIDAPGFTVAVSLDTHPTRVKEYRAEPKIPPEVSNVTSYRFSRLTIDIDSPVLPAEAVDNANRVGRFALFRTARGYHIRADLGQPLGFDELIKLRSNCQDDPERLNIDMAYHEAGLDFLTNLLFNEKAWVGRGDKIESYAEREIGLGEADVRRSGQLSISLPNVAIDGVIRVEVVGSCVKATGPADILTKQHFDSIVRSIEDNFWEYQFQSQRRESIRDAVVRAYMRVSPMKSAYAAARLLEKCAIEPAGDAVIIRVPDELSERAGALIGRQGQIIRQAEEHLGFRIVVQRTPQPPKPRSEADEMRERLEAILKDMLDISR